MKLSIDWLSEFVDLSGVEPEALARHLTLSTAEIEGVERIGESLSGIVAARVGRVRPHPSSKQLSLAEVDSGSFQGEVVCGAPNVRPGAMAAFAAVGTTLPGGERIQARSVAGIRSEGMLCSAEELRLGDDGTGLLLLP